MLEVWVSGSQDGDYLIVADGERGVIAALTAIGVQASFIRWEELPLEVIAETLGVRTARALYQIVTALRSEIDQVATELSLTINRRPLSRRDTPFVWRTLGRDEVVFLVLPNGSRAPVEVQKIIERAKPQAPVVVAVRQSNHWVVRR